jgi:hypothetical protein
MNDKDTAGEQERCPDCGHPVVYDAVESTAMGSGGGREQQRGAPICVNEECAMYRRHLNMG